MLLNFRSFQHTFPRTLESLVLNILGPTGAEILTRKFDEMDQPSTPEEQGGASRVISPLHPRDARKLLIGMMQDRVLQDILHCVQ